MAVEELQKKNPSLPQIAPNYQSVSCRRVCEKQFETECVVRVTLFWASNVRSHFGRFLWKNGKKLLFYCHILLSKTLRCLKFGKNAHVAMCYGQKSITVHSLQFTYYIQSVGKFGQFLTPPPLKSAAVLNGWSLRVFDDMKLQNH